MIKDISTKQINAQQTLTTAWLILSILALFLASFYEWHRFQEQKNNQITQAAQAQSFQFDEFIENLLQSAYALTFTDQQFRDCKTGLLPILQQLIFNTPDLSAIAVSDSNGKIVCSTIDYQPSISSSSPEPHLYGPINPGGKHKPVYILQQRLGHYRFTLYILKNMLENVLYPLKPNTFRAITLYDQQHQQSLLQIDNQPNSDEQLKPLGNPDAVRVASQTLDDFQLLYTPTKLLYDKQFIYREAIIVLSVGLLALCSYIVMRQLLNKRFSLGYALANGLKQEHFEPIYQPVIDVASNRISGVEVLVRWHMESQKTIMPDLFIDEAEKSGLIVPITLQLIRKTFNECGDFLLKNPDFHLAFNVSTNHFRDSSFFDQFYRLCEEHDIKSEQIILELTERQLFDQDDERSILQMKELRDKGFSLAIDDFGTGHASINYLQHLPFNYLKIDKLFIQAIGTGAITEVLNQAIINMANSLNLAIIAEGVETIEQYEYLRQQKVSYIQGWYFAKAMSIEQLTVFVQENKS